MQIYCRRWRRHGRRRTPCPVGVGSVPASASRPHATTPSTSIPASSPCRSPTDVSHAGPTTNSNWSNRSSQTPFYYLHKYFNSIKFDSFIHLTIWDGDGSGVDISIAANRWPHRFLCYIFASSSSSSSSSSLFVQRKMTNNS